MNLPKIILKPGKEQSIKRYHPWIFSGAIQTMNKGINEGELVTITDSKGEFLAIGHYQIGSIAVRIISFTNTEIDQQFWNTKIKKAYELRKMLGLAENKNNNVYRLIHGEGDGLPGLIIDFYNGTAVTQMHSIGMYLCMNQITEALKNIYGNKLTAIYDKSESTIPFKSDIYPKNGYLYGSLSEDIVLEYGNKFKISWEDGQKTGFFIDQRENRKLLSEYAEGRAVLNVFSYTGGFSVYALNGKAKFVHSVDSSQKAIDLTNENVAMNLPGTSNHEAFAVDAFEFMNTIDNKYDLIILDPPAFAKHNNALKNALQAYKRINAKAIEKIKPGGILFTFSCSQVVSKEEFRKSVFAAAANTGRNVRILHQLTQPGDHPVNIYHPEGEYLKGLVIYVE
ncbi:MAG: SAM-dependent methyltransferase [Bacteroidetes bacterium GWC2_33_15]|nr:MAG: SAM-dependent methyltransferase [Bacteroidetes bacterium GWA2_33_15]OFX50944.1 MAG: SAM-dependent methyltransferase [Bacteroidetes bacterium GWC2_33_15]OFX66551.1 MAG: SAM-dependent methyltransferase [Bacteroidetes bacterium GWB2_32_14]OFX70170.1 MAG: SAM-dependent methyltransferase [Bacteroidetes bacterium GWD2_33_33]HAN20018.1 RlmI/RlmK family 23S rRNA methyltransferase [Bacteroidales bacterium]